MGTWKTRGLRGSTLEELINRTNEKYLEGGLALIQKIPTPITPIKIDKDYVEEITDDVPVYRTEYYTDTEERPVYRQEPVYKTKYYYEIDKWLYERSVKTSGKDKNPYWGEVILASDERISSKRDNYSILGFNKKQKEKSITLSYEDWNSLNVGETVTLKVSFGYGEIVE